MRSILLTFFVRLIFWVLCIYLTVYFLTIAITDKNVFWVSTVHLLIVLFSVILMFGAPGDKIEGY